MSDEERRIELGNFLRVRRQSLQPEEVGLHRRNMHRRTPGLRREDVAELSGISLTWYTWLEQGRSIQASVLVLNRLANVLQLDVTERAYLFALAIPQIPSLTLRLLESVTPKIQRLLDDYTTNPAYLLGSHFEILAWNQIATDVFCDFAKIPLTERNVLAIVFSDHMRELIVNWESLAQDSLAALRASANCKSNELWYTSLVEELSKRSPEFRMWWAQHKVQRIPEICAKLDHPIVGLLVLEQTVLMFHENPELQIIVYTPHPETDSANKLQQLTTLRALAEMNVNRS
jgi:transcriptional regulator with XRE-family HTH domain